MRWTQTFLAACLISTAVSAQPTRDRPAPLYIVSMMHAEDRPWFMHDQARFEAHAENLRALTDLFVDHGAKLAFQPDWTFIEGAKQWDPDLFTWMLNQGMGVDSHTHAKQGHTLESVAELLVGCGVPAVRIGNGHFNKRRLPGTNMFWAFSQLYGNTGEPYFEAICAYKDATTGEVDRSCTVWRPARVGDWHVHDPNSPVAYIGGGPMGALRSSQQLQEYLTWHLARVQPGRINVFYWHDSAHNYGPGPGGPRRIEDWDDFLTQTLDPLAAEGKVKWATFSEILDAHLALEASGNLGIAAGDTIPQLLGPATPQPMPR